MKLAFWQEWIIRQPFVCPKCSRRFPRDLPPKKMRCPDHARPVPVWDQSDLAAEFERLRES